MTDVHPNVQVASAVVAEHMNDILRCFKPGAKITVLVRHPDKPDGSQDYVLTNDELDAAITALQIRIDPNIETLIFTTQLSAPCANKSQEPDLNEWDDHDSEAS